MKKVMSLLLALTMCLGLCVPAFAEEQLSVNNDDSIFYTTERDGYTIVFSTEPPPGMDISMDLNDTKGYEDDCPHTRPLGYKLMGRYYGNTTFDAIYNHTMLTISCSVLSAVAGGGAGAGFFISWAFGLPSAISGPSSISGNYTTDSFDCLNPGMYSYIYWHHTACCVDYDGDGIEEYICKAYYEYALLP